MTKRRAVSPRPKSRALTSKQAAALLAGAPEPDPEIARLALARAYRLDAEQSLLVYEDGKGILYESRAALLAMMEAVAAMSPGDGLADLLPQGQAFPGQSQALAAALGIAGVTELDGVVRAAGAPACLRGPLFGQLVAYAGEAIVAASGGRWQMRQGADGGWEAWVIDAAGREHPVSGLVLKELTEWDETSSLAGMLHGHLAR